MKSPLSIRKTASVVLFALACSSTSYSQKLHSPQEIFKIMSDSKLGYQISDIPDSLSGKIVAPDYSSRLNAHNAYRVKTDSGYVLRRFKPNQQAQGYYDNAETFFSSHDADVALKYYKQAYEADTTFYQVLTYIGQIYEGKRDLENAKVWYRKAIQKNPVDYMAHWFLADAFLNAGDKERAKEEITMALLFNRNNLRLKKSFANIMSKAGLQAEDWSFNPQMKLKQESDTMISVAVDELWIGYATSKALWFFEPGYKASMGVEPGSYSMLEDRECLLNQYMVMQNNSNKYKKHQQLKVLKNAIENKYLDEFILFEIVLPQNPAVVYQLSPESIDRLKDYVLKIRQA